VHAVRLPRRSRKAARVSPDGRLTKNALVIVPLAAARAITPPPLVAPPPLHAGPLMLSLPTLGILREGSREGMLMKRIDVEALKRAYAAA
jgi:hypothetical protein